MPPPWSSADNTDMFSMAEYAPAKINLHLHILGRRKDGYHLLDSLAVFAAVGDRLSVTPADDLSLTVTGPFASDLAAESDNLVLRAARALAVRVGVAARGRLVLEKNLPVSSGIGGGSADAAAALRLLSRFWRIVPRAELSDLARELGADVPVCLRDQPAIMSGIGELLAPVPRLPDVGIVLINPGVAVSTPEVFRARNGAFSQPASFPAGGWQDSESLAASLHTVGNDLERPARTLAPSIGDALATLEGLPKCLLARMSGSGATCFGLFSTPQAALDAAQTAFRTGWWVWGGGLNHNPTRE